MSAYLGLEPPPFFYQPIPQVYSHQAAYYQPQPEQTLFIPQPAVAPVSVSPPGFSPHLLQLGPLVQTVPQVAPVLLEQGFGQPQFTFHTHYDAPSDFSFASIAPPAEPTHYQFQETITLREPAQIHPLQPPSILNEERYKTELCRTFKDTGECPYDEKCQYAHGRNELRPGPTKPKKYKTAYCRNFSERGSCPYGERCNYIHDESEEVLQSLKQLSTSDRSPTGSEKAAGTDQAGSPTYEEVKHKDDESRGYYDANQSPQHPSRKHQNAREQPPRQRRRQTRRRNLPRAGQQPNPLQHQPNPAQHQPVASAPQMHPLSQIIPPRGSAQQALAKPGIEFVSYHSDPMHNPLVMPSNNAVPSNSHHQTHEYSPHSQVATPPEYYQNFNENPAFISSGHPEIRAANDMLEVHIEEKHNNYQDPNVTAQAQVAAIAAPQAHTPQTRLSTSVAGLEALVSPRNSHAQNKNLEARCGNGNQPKARKDNHNRRSSVILESKPAQNPNVGYGVVGSPSRARGDSNATREDEGIVEQKQRCPEGEEPQSDNSRNSDRVFRPSGGFALDSTEEELKDHNGLFPNGEYNSENLKATLRMSMDSGTSPGASDVPDRRFRRSISQPMPRQHSADTVSGPLPDAFKKPPSTANENKFSESNHLQPSAARTRTRKTRALSDPKNDASSRSRGTLKFLNIDHNEIFS